MKKITYLLIAAFVTLSVASCVKDQFEKVGPENPYGAEITVSLAPGTRTDLLEGKTVWAEGDLVWVSNGAAVDTIEVPEDAYGLSEFSFKTVNATPTEANPDVFIVYPVFAAKSIKDGKVVVNVPSTQDGEFSSANICAGKSNNGAVALRNVTALLSVEIPDETEAFIYQLAFSTAGDTPLCGECTVDLSGGDPVVTAAKTSGSVIVQVEGMPGRKYVSVIPGKYEAGFKVTAATMDFEHASQTKVSTDANTVNINEIVDLGVIGTDLQPLSGDGSEANPYLIETLGHLIAISSTIEGDAGKDDADKVNGFVGKYFLLANDIEGVTTPVASNEFPFRGNFNGNNKTITLAISSASNRVGLFSVLGDDANVHDLTLEGKVNVSGQYSGALVGSAKGAAADSGRVVIRNIINWATVSGSTSVAGIAGYTKYADIEDCYNMATIEGTSNVAGVVAYSYYSVVSSSNNSGSIIDKATSGTGMYFPAGNNYSASNYNNGTGGVVGWAQNSTAKDLTNTGDVSGFNKVGGVVGSAYWTSCNNLINSGKIVANGHYQGGNIGSQMQCTFGSAAGGVIGWLHVGSVTNCRNSGTVDGKLGLGGVVGFANTTNAAAGKISFANLSNTGKVTSDVTGLGNFPRGIAGFNAGTGGIIGTVLRFGPQVSVTISNCKNTADVFSPSVNTGGIVGLMADHGNTLKPQYSYVDHCVNEGKVTGGPYWVGGIVGYSFARYVGRLVIRNCANHGTVTGTRESGNGTVAGGIIGGLGSNSSSYRSDTQYDYLWIYNNYNDADVVYSSLNLTVPYVGGIVGNLWATARVKNNYNIGYVGPADKSEPVEEALLYLGGVAAYQYGDYVSLCYSSNKVLNGQTIGPKSEALAPETVCSFDPDNECQLSTSVTVGTVTCQYLLDALNAWVGSSTDYSPWIAGGKGPVFAED